MPQSLARILVHTVFSTKERFNWQNGYGMFSLGASQIEEVRRYIAEQEQHHRQLSFQDEFRRLLKRYELAYDERYVWD
jgi:REP-associated tyrosine transposase